MDRRSFLVSLGITAAAAALPAVASATCPAPAMSYPEAAPMPPALPMVVATRQPITLKPGITRANIEGAFAKVYKYSGDDVGVLYLNPNSLDTFIKATETLGQWGFTRESRYSVLSRTSWSKDQNFNGSPGDIACAGMFYTEGRHIMGYVLGFDIVADPELPLDEFRVRDARVSLVETPKNSVAFPVEWVELSTQGFFRKTAIYTRPATDRGVVLYRDEKVEEQYFDA